MNNDFYMRVYSVSNDYFHKPEWIRKLAEKVLPRCSYRQWKTGAICNNPGEPCFLPNFMEEGDEQIEWVCIEHMADAGFCRRCGTFNAGIESFELIHPGLCDNCNYEEEAEERRWEEDEFDYDGYETLDDVI